MSKSSCLKESEVKASREKEILVQTTKFLRGVAINLCSLEGVSGRVDVAFKIDRKKLIAQAMKKVAEELDGTEHSGHDKTPKRDGP